MTLQRMFWIAILWPLLPIVLWNRRKRIKKAKAKEKKRLAYERRKKKREAKVKVVMPCGKEVEAEPGEVIDLKYSGHLWMGKPIEALDDGHLWNIIQAIRRGTWKGGGECRIKYGLAQALKKESRRRGWKPEDAVTFEKRNKEWEENRDREILRRLEQGQSVY